MADVGLNMTIEGLLIQPIEVQLSSFSFDSSASSALYSGLSASSSTSKNFTIQRASDEWSIQLRQASQTGRQMQITITGFEQLNDSSRPVTFAFTNVLIKSIRSSGTGARGIVETVHFEAEGVDFDHSSPPSGGASYKGPHKGKTK